ncbi:hypothetical protein [Methylobacter sp.]|jgi:hypothetical protein|uniref:hypothetical protein n=1 Tax=Methylobacter sp. TaxID=2051955 RepID=UPI003DA66BA3
MKLSGALPWVGLLILSGCTQTDIEYDRMTGTTFPPNQTVDGKQVTISSIYATESYMVNVVEDETNIAALTGPANPSDPNQYDYITESELDTLERARRSSPVGKTSWICASFGFFPTYCTTYHIYGIVVNHFKEEDDGTRDIYIMGQMWTTNNRRAFANFYRNTAVSGDGGKFLRSAAHEIGHAFNLHHEDADGSTDIMNQTGKVGNNYVYRFIAAASKNHLKDHPDECKYPGLSAFHAAHSNHANHGITAPPCPFLFLPLPGKDQ